MEPKADESSVSLLTGYNANEEIIWEGTTWPLSFLSPLTLSSVSWKITNKKIEKTSGFRGRKYEIIDLRRVTDISFNRSCHQMCLKRGSIVIYSTASLDPVVTIDTWGLKDVYRQVKEAWLSSNAIQFVMAS